MRIVFFSAVLVIATFAGVSHAGNPMVPFPVGPVGTGVIAPMLPNESGAMVPNVPGSSAPPVTCSNALDFTDGCNSQYLGMMRI